MTMKNRADVSYNVSADYTRLQRDLYKELKHKADDLNSKNPPVKKYVKYFKDTPELCFEKNPPVKKYVKYFKDTPELCFERSRSGNDTGASRNNLRNSTSPKNQKLDQRV